MMKEYIVSIKIGNYKTSAWVVGFDKRFHGEVLKLRWDYRSEQQLYTVVYADGAGNFSNEPLGEPVFGFIRKIDELRCDGKACKALTAFIKSLYVRMLKYNDILKVDGKGCTNFYLCVTYPSNWTKKEGQDYAYFLNDALKPFGVEITWVINESIAAYANYYLQDISLRNVDKCVLLIDYGPTAINYTVMHCGIVVPELSWSDYSLGASNIEKIILADYSKQEEFQKVYQKTMDKLRCDALESVNILSELLFEIKKEKEFSVEVERYPDLMLHLNLIERHDILVRSDPNWRRDKMTYLFDYECNMDEVLNDYKAELLQSFRNISKKISHFGGLQADSVVLYGGGTLMPWVKSIVMDGFATKKVFMCDPMPEARGGALYAREKLLNVVKY
ncbi:hypothetical protein [uncultured Prevotella sp.]|uniref:hypothetical protein n=1 Tax=uncultured Prevotella sp. TaxID=159272 RepID=UPI002613D220|nr:hypothetical protein [uncultured Prevotella sp.]